MSAGLLSLESVLVRLPVVLFALTLHEYMHAYVAYRCGDPTAYRAGRVTLNPLPHLDLLGTICLMVGPIGWAKPVPVNPYNYGKPRRDEILVSGAGVAANFVLAAVLALVVRGLVWLNLVPQTEMGRILWAMLSTAIFVNFALAIFNLLPIAPLDGSHIVMELLPWRARERYAAAMRYGPFILLGLLAGDEGAWRVWEAIASLK